MSLDTIDKPHEPIDKKTKKIETPKKNVPWFVQTLGVVIAALVLSMFIRTFVAEVYLVPSGSMLQTIQLGDRLVGEKITYRFAEPKAGDIVTFKSPEDNTTILVKRVIATGGQTVALQEGKVVVDGKALDEPYTAGKLSYPLDQVAVEGGLSYPYTVPKGYVWVMGDNRTNSLDSRYFGPVPVANITSRCLFIYWPFEDASML
ncbi:MAG: signal peptidase I [Atopobium sp.]|uniref:signal peptidase I n=1 Tax=Atopobium sp. TaxID=1872650 RepID=UPI002A758665|nr:signal peptidase I [Atopobium sp.]MDY2788457.1 signal peptidase I [Atopobium sp.]MDY4522130.1 signal peptidase I [Atopobium sp.]